MNLGEQNLRYWSNYQAGTTPGLHEVPAAELLELLPEHAKVLDVGTGTGTLAQALSEIGLDTYAIDINQNEIKALQAQESSVHYSVQDITQPTTFTDDYFDLVLFRYTLTNVHKDQWSGLKKEITRIVKPGGYVWLAEPLVNEAYSARYELGKESLHDLHALYVFKDKTLAARVTTADELTKAIAQDQIARIVRHYSEEELRALFPGFTQVNSAHVNDVSPSGYPLDTVVMTLQKLNN